MKRIIILILFPLSLYSQMYMNPIAILKSSNEFELIREEQEVTASIIDTVYKNEFFHFVPSDEDWLKVEPIGGQEGYLNRQFIQPFLEQEEEKISGYLLDIFKQEKENYLELDQSSWEYKYFQKSTFYPATNLFEHFICENNDIKLFQEFIKIVELQYGSAQEVVPSTLAGVFICKPDWTFEIIAPNGNCDYRIMKQLKCGFGLRTYGIESEINNYKELKEKIENLN